MASSSVLWPFPQTCPPLTHTQLSSSCPAPTDCFFLKHRSDPYWTGRAAAGTIGQSYIHSNRDCVAGLEPPEKSPESWFSQGWKTRALHGVRVRRLTQSWWKQTERSREDSRWKMAESLVIWSCQHPCLQVMFLSHVAWGPQLGPGQSHEEQTKPEQTSQ